MKEKLIIKPSSWYRIFEIIACHILIFVLLPLLPLLFFDNLEISNNFRTIILVSILVIIIFSLAIAIRAYMKEAWIIEGEQMHQFRTVIGFGMKESIIPLKSIYDVGVTQIYSMRLWPVRDLHVRYKNNGRDLGEEIVLPRGYCIRIQIFIKEYAEALQNNKEFDVIGKFPKR